MEPGRASGGVAGVRQQCLLHFAGHAGRCLLHTHGRLLDVAGGGLPRRLRVVAGQRQQVHGDGSDRADDRADDEDDKVPEVAGEQCGPEGARGVEGGRGDRGEGEDADGEHEADRERCVAAGLRLGVRRDLEDRQHDDEHADELACAGKHGEVRAGGGLRERRRAHAPGLGF